MPSPANLCRRVAEVWIDKVGYIFVYMYTQSVSATVISSMVFLGWDKISFLLLQLSLSRSFIVSIVFMFALQEDILDLCRQIQTLVACSVQKCSLWEKTVFFLFVFIDSSLLHQSWDALLFCRTISLLATREEVAFSIQATSGQIFCGWGFMIVSLLVSACLESVVDQVLL